MAKVIAVTADTNNPNRINALVWPSKKAFAAECSWIDDRWLQIIDGGHEQANAIKSGFELVDLIDTANKNPTPENIQKLEIYKLFYALLNGQDSPAFVDLPTTVRQSDLENPDYIAYLESEAEAKDRNDQAIKLRNERIAARKAKTEQVKNFPTMSKPMLLEYLRETIELKQAIKVSAIGEEDFETAIKCTGELKLLDTIIHQIEVGRFNDGEVE
ncbi:MULTISPECIES: hypothetical protein [unclassified Vibrio]|uniref:hypothetical protein n=1 Tax=unclassified Vibrio TaxID=2614977 RepID=UPI001267DBAB|nr:MULTISPECIES: hypothetical protein [unclassified Vibrio]QFT40085.1 hypothetical protein FIU99_27215 [Vibrio sp. THAF64]QGM38030.1 hypothetical protein GGC04_27420 [Vibrio sp. THAF191d]QGN73511.1 hypothetical protein GGC03_27360 [Vibrio sp. THAF191c]